MSKPISKSKSKSKSVSKSDIDDEEAPFVLPTLAMVQAYLSVPKKQKIRILSEMVILKIFLL